MLSADSVVFRLCEEMAVRWENWIVTATKVDMTATNMTVTIRVEPEFVL